MRDEKEERKKQARSNKQTRQSNTAHPRQSLFHVHSTHSQMVSERHLMKYVSEGLSGENVEVRIAACKCLHSLSRSTKLLRTTIIDAEVWRPVLEVCMLLCWSVRICLVCCVALPCLFV